MTTAKNAKQDGKYKLVPPEGGWGYVIALGKVVTFISVFGSLYGFALIFNDFLKESGIGTSIVAVLVSCSSAAMSIAGLFSNTLAEKFSRRSTGIAAAIAYCLGDLFQVFAYSAWPLFAASIIHGAALGIMFPILFSTFNQYFVERRTFITSATNILIGIGEVASPLTVQYLLETFGFRGCLAILMGINFHTVLGMWVMHPVEWHMKKVLIDEKGSDDKSTRNIREEVKNGEAENDHQLRPLIAQPELLTKPIDRPSRTDSRIHSVKSSRVNSRKASIVDVLDCTGSLIISDAGDRNGKPQATKTKKVAGKYLDLDLLKDPHYVILIFGIVITFYADYSFSSFQPLHLFELKYTKVEVSRIIAIGTVGDLVSRCVLTAFTAFKTLPPKLYYCVALTFMIILRYVFFYIDGFWAMAIITAAIGFVKTWITIPVELIFAEYLPKEKFASGYGLYMFLNGMFMLGIGPIIRFVKEYSKSYIAVFHFLNILLILNAIVWSVEYLWVLSKRKNGNAAIDNSHHGTSKA